MSKAALHGCSTAELEKQWLSFYFTEYNLGLWRTFGLMRHTDPVLPAVLFSTVWYSFRNIKLTPQWDNYLSVNPSSAYCWLACIRASAAGLKWIRRLIVCWLLPDKKRNSWINFVIFKSLILSLMFSLYMQNPKSGGLQTLKHTEGIPANTTYMCTLLTLKMTLICYNKLRIHLTLI